MKRFALAGNPNSGKTTLFNNLTGSTAHVGNWPGVTVEKKDGVYKRLKEPIAIIDLPGIYSLSPYTSEEVVSRNYILDEKPDCVINIVDATNLERNLYLSTQLLEIDVPVVVAINMMDVLEKAGDSLNAHLLEEIFGVPVIKISALEEDNLKELMERAYQASESPRNGFSIIQNKQLKHLIGDLTIAFKHQKIDNPLFHAIKLVENDGIEVKMHPDLLPMVEDYKKTLNDETFGDDVEAIIADERYDYISSNFASVITHKNNQKIEKNKSNRIDRVLTNKVFGLIILAAILFFVFHLTFSENLFFLGRLFNDVAPSFKGTAYEGLIWTDVGINSPGVIFSNLFEMSFASIIEATKDGLTASLSEGHWLIGFIGDGVLAGLFAVLGFLPQILLLFFFFSIMEDTGYMARVAFILDRLFRKFGLSGRAFIPMIMGFGCSVPAMVNTRTLVDEKEKISTIRVIPFFSCGAKLPILVSIAGGVAQTFGFSYVDLITYSMYVVGIITAIIAVLILRNTTLKGDAAPFIMELPQYHLPKFKSLMIHLWDKIKHFITKAFTIILASTIIVWFLSNFAWNWHMVSDMKDSILASIGKLLQPLFTPLGFGSQLASAGWVFAVALITGLIAKENVIATFITLGSVAIGYLNSVAIDPDILITLEVDSEGVTAVSQMIQATGITWQGAISFIAFNMLTIPCFAACATAKGELRKGTFINTIMFWLIVSFLGAGFTYAFLSCFSNNSLHWALPVTISMFIALAVTFFLLFFKNKNSTLRA